MSNAARPPHLVRRAEKPSAAAKTGPLGAKSTKNDAPRPLPERNTIPRLMCPQTENPKARHRTARPRRTVGVTFDSSIFKVHAGTSLLLNYSPCVKARRGLAMLRHTARPRYLTTTGEPPPLDTEWTFSFADLMKNGEGSPLVNDSSASSAKLSSTG